MSYVRKLRQVGDSTVQAYRKKGQNILNISMEVSGTYPVCEGQFADPSILAV
jgi:hypothetical protein